MALAQIEHDGGSGPRLYIAHGLYGSGRNWGVIAKRLSQGRPVTAFDMRNHGLSPWYDTNSYEDMADDLAREIQPGSDLMGHSMGGKAAMTLALSKPELLRKLIVADIAPVAYGHDPSDLIDAMTGVDLSKVDRRSDADEALRGVVPDAAVRAFILQSLDPGARRWRLNLDVLRAEMPKIVGFPDISGSFAGPTLFLYGSESNYVLREHRALIKEKFPKAIFAKIPGAGHWLHAEKPREFTETVATFLAA